MKHLQTFESFLNEGEESWSKAQLDKEITEFVRDVKDAGDIERLTYEFHRKQSDWRFL